MKQIFISVMSSNISDVWGLKIQTLALQNKLIIISVLNTANNYSGYSFLD